MNRTNSNREYLLRVAGVTMAAWVGLALAGCREAAPPPHMAVDLGSEGQPLPPTSSEWTNPAINEGQAEWIPFRGAGGSRRVESADDAESADTADPSADEEHGTGSTDVNAEIVGVLGEYNKLAAENNVDEMVRYFVEAQEAQLRAAYAELTTVRESVTKLTEKLKAQDGADEAAITKALEKVSRFASGELRATESHAHEDEKIHITFEPGIFLAGAHATLDGKDWYLEAMELPAVDEIKGKLAPVAERLNALVEGTTETGEVMSALEAIELPALGSADHEESPPAEGDAAPPEAEGESE